MADFLHETTKQCLLYVCENLAALAPPPPAASWTRMGDRQANVMARIVRWDLGGFATAVFTVKKEMWLVRRTMNICVGFR